MGKHRELDDASGLKIGTNSSTPVLRCCLLVQPTPGGGEGGRFLTLPLPFGGTGLMGRRGGTENVVGVLRRRWSRSATASGSGLVHDRGGEGRPESTLMQEGGRDSRVPITTRFPSPGSLKPEDPIMHPLSMGEMSRQVQKAMAADPVMRHLGTAREKFPTACPLYQCPWSR